MPRSTSAGRSRRYGTNLTNDLSHTTAGGTTSITGSLNRKNFAPLPAQTGSGLKVSYTF